MKSIRIPDSGMTKNIHQLKCFETCSRNSKKNKYPIWKKTMD